MDINISLSGLNDQQKMRVLEVILDSSEHAQSSTDEYERGGINIALEKDDVSMLTEEDLTPEELPEDIILELEQNAEVAYNGHGPEHIDTDKMDFD